MGSWSNAAHDLGHHVYRRHLPDRPEGSANHCTIALQLGAFVGRETVGRVLAVERPLDAVVHRIAACCWGKGRFRR
jgi:hypothetical protein